jgi:squalene synthase HpnC
LNQINIDLAYTECRKIALKHYENFPVGSLLIPSDKRKYVYSIYAFARFADDIADSRDLMRDEKIQKLDLLERELDKIRDNRPDDFTEETSYIFISLFDTINSIGIQISEFRDLISAFIQDSLGFHYKSVDDLLDYSKRSANPIGHLVLNVFGYRKDGNERMFDCSDHICSALQLTNFWQDVSVDLEMERIYVPEECMLSHGYTLSDLRARIENENFREVMKELCDITENMFRAGEELPGMVEGRLKYELRATINGGRKIIEKIREMDFKVLNQRPVLSAIEKATIVLKALI